LIVIAFVLMSSTMAIHLVSEASFIGPTTLHSYSMLIGGTSSIEERSKKVYEYKSSHLKAQNQNQDTAKNDAVLRFAATYTYTTSPVYLQTRTNGTKTSSSSSTLHDFFNSKDHRNCLLIGSGNIKVKKSGVKTKVDIISNQPLILVGMKRLRISNHVELNL
jgi:hypothetical protein